MQIKPGQITPNELEIKILELLVDSAPALKPLTAELHVLSRTYTGVGSYTKFKHPETEGLLGNSHIGLNALINVPHIEHGLGALLFCENGNAICLEIYSYGSELWDGNYENFSINQIT